MKYVKWIGIALLAYVGIVIAFESMIGLLQPRAGSTLVITTTDEKGNLNDRVLARLDSGGELFVSANHWPRAWFREALENPNVRVELEEGTGDYVARPASEEEYRRVDAENPHPLAFRFVTGFPPREILRLDPRP